MTILPLFLDWLDYSMIDAGQKYYIALGYFSSFHEWVFVWTIHYKYKYEQQIGHMSGVSHDIGEIIRYSIYEGFMFIILIN